MPAQTALLLGVLLSGSTVAAGEDKRLIEPVGPVAIGANLVQLGDGTWETYRAARTGVSYRLLRTRSKDQGRTWLAAEAVRDLPGEPWGGCVALLDRKGEVQLFFLRLRLEGTGRRIAIDRCIDVWHLRSEATRTRWSEPQRIFKGYTGSIQGALQLASGRLLLPLGVWVPGRPTAPPTGAHDVTTLFSDDAGTTWQQSSARLVSPCVADYNGANYGACEPVAIQRKDGTVWMLLRTQAGVLYESFSRDGSHWSEARPSRFASSNSPAALARLADGRLVVCWNHCVMPPRVAGQGVYAGRDALHLAIADPEGKRWRGYREVYLDTQRDATPPRRGDRGTAYPFLVVTREGKIAVISGQGSGRRALTLVDPAWLLQTRRQDDFSAGLSGWCVFSEFGPAKGFWRDRQPGAVRAVHPDRASAHVLHVRRARADRPADGAVWNVPWAARGKLTLRLRLEKGGQGSTIALTDRFFNPTDDQGEAKALFRLDLTGDGRIGETRALTPGRWTDLELTWDVAGKKAQVKINGTQTLTLSAQAASAGVCYLRLRSRAREVDRAGVLIEKVTVEVQP